MNNIIEFENFKKEWEKEPIVILDTNIFLDLYRHSVDASKEIIAILSKIKETIWVPNQVYCEFNENKEKVKNEQYNKYKNIPKEINGIIKAAKDKVSGRFIKYKKYQFPNIDKLEQEFINNFEELSNKLENFIKDISDEEVKNKDMLRNNTIESFIDDIVKAGNIGQGFNLVELISIYQEGEARYKYQIPPGYEDAKEKDDLNKFGDLLLWKQLINYAKINEKCVVFITNDVKEDWWELSEENGEKKIVAPRKELLEEFSIYTEKKVCLNMITLQEAIGHLSKIFNINSLNTMLELNARDYIERINGKLFSEIESEFTDYINGLDVYEITDLVGEDFDEIELVGLGDIQIVDVYLDFESDKVLYNIEFDVSIECDTTAHYKEFSISKGQVSLEVKGNFTFERTIDYEVKDIQELSDEYTGFSLDSIDVVRSQFVYDEDYLGNDDICVICGNEVGVYNYNDEGLICEKCTKQSGGSKYTICPDCGRVVPWEKMGGDGFCNSCSK